MKNLLLMAVLLTGCTFTTNQHEHHHYGPKVAPEDVTPVNGSYKLVPLTPETVTPGEISNVSRGPTPDTYNVDAYGSMRPSKDEMSGETIKRYAMMKSIGPVMKPGLMNVVEF